MSSSNALILGAGLVGGFLLLQAMKGPGLDLGSVGDFLRGDESRGKPARPDEVMQKRGKKSDSVVMRGTSRRKRAERREMVSDGNTGVTYGKKKRGQFVNTAREMWTGEAEERENMPGNML